FRNAGDCWVPGGSGQYIPARQTPSSWLGGRLDMTGSGKSGRPCRRMHLENDSPAVLWRSEALGGPPAGPGCSVGRAAVGQGTPGRFAPTFAHIFEALRKAGAWGLTPAWRRSPTPWPPGPKNGSGKFGTPWVRMQCAFAIIASFCAPVIGRGSLAAARWQVLAAVV